jgi:hypothetical protein
MRKVLVIAVLLIVSYIAARSISVPNIAQEYYIGQVIDVEIDLSKEQPEKLLVDTGASSKQIEVFDIKPVPEKAWHYLVRIAPFDTGYVQTERIPIYLLSPNQTDTLYIEPFSVYVKTSLTPADSLLKDSAPPVPFHLKFIDYLVPVLVLAAIIVGIYYLRKLTRKEKRVAEPVFVDNRPAWLIALELLKAFREKQLLETGQYLEFYFELSMIFRIFLEKHFNINAAEMTTYEIKQALPLVDERVQILATLNDMDKIKFAKFTPEFNEAKRILDWREEYIRAFAREAGDV